MVYQFPNVRRSTTCVCCGGSKSVGLLLCWTCHGTQKERNDGNYSGEVTANLVEADNRLSPTPDVSKAEFGAWGRS